MTRNCASLQLTIQGAKITGLTASANTDPIDVSGYSELIAFINMTAETGTTPTLDCKLQYSPDGQNWADSGDAFTQITTTTGVTFKKASSIFGKWVRLVFTLGGTSPNYTFVPSLFGKE